MGHPPSAPHESRCLTRPTPHSTHAQHPHSTHTQHPHSTHTQHPHSTLTAPTRSTHTQHPHSTRVHHLSLCVCLLCQGQGRRAVGADEGRLSSVLPSSPRLTAGGSHHSYIKSPRRSSPALSPGSPSKRCGALCFRVAIFGFCVGIVIRARDSDATYGLKHACVGASRAH